jgi:two-component system, sensor histidine kinase and response regulator
MSNHDPSCGGLTSSGFDPNALFRRLDGDIELLRDLVQIFSEESPLLLKDISIAIQHGSFEDVRKLSHKLKGSALQFSGDGVASLAASLEQMGAHQSLDGAARIFSDLEQAVANLECSLQSIAKRERWTS